MDLIRRVVEGVRNLLGPSMMLPRLGPLADITASASNANIVREHGYVPHQPTKPRAPPRQVHPPVSRGLWRGHAVRRGGRRSARVGASPEADDGGGGEVVRSAALNEPVPDDGSNLEPPVFEQAVERVEPLQLPDSARPPRPRGRRPRTFWPMLENVPEDPGPESVKPAARRRRSKRTALGKMIRDRDVDGVGSTLAASPELLSRPCEDGSLTPLMCAVLSGSRRMLRAVIRAGASLDALSSEGMTALDLARARGFEKAVGVLERQEKKLRSLNSRAVDAL